jgi:tetratricopeptide (TPR) repeat protein
MERPLIMQSSHNGDALRLVALQDQVARARQDGDHRVEQELQLARERYLRKQFDLAMEAFAAAYVLSMLTRDARSRLLALLGMSRLSLRSQECEQATGLLEMGLELAREQADRLAEAECLSGLGHTALLTGNPPRARILAEQARAVLRECGDKVAEADVLNLLAVAHTRLGQVVQAVSLHREGILLAREWQALSVEASHLSNRGILQVCELGQPEQGMADLGRALDLFGELGDDEGAVQTLALLATGALQQQSWEETLGYIERARAIPHGLKWMEHRLCFLAADAYAGLGRSEESLHERGLAFASLFPNWAMGKRSLLEDHRAALEEARGRGDRRAEATELLFLARQQAHTTGLRGYLAYFEQAIEVYRSLGDLYQVGGLLVDLGVGLAMNYPGARLRGKRARALAFWRTGLDIRRQARRALSIHGSRWGGDELAPLFALDDRKLALVSRSEEQELERLKERWGERAFQHAWKASERYYRALSTSFAAVGSDGSGEGRW